MSSWYFPSNDFGEVKGINDSGVATFRGTPLQSLAREICQNSLDASTKFPVKVEFDTFLLSTNEVPGVEVLRDTFNRCLKFWEGQESVTTKNFFKNAISQITKDEISILRISDFNTKGLQGADDTTNINTDWYRLTKSSGSSDKKGPAGGSFGIGKFAPFACSDFSTVFYSTYDETDKVAYQGVSRLVTFEREDGNNTQGTGYFGNERNTPILSDFKIDRKFNRNHMEYGTDIFILGYKYGGETWEDKIVTAVLDGFLGAVWNNKLIVEVGDITISKQTLSELMSKYKDELASVKSYAFEYYQVLLSKETKWFEESNHMGLGSIRFGVLIGDSDFHRRAAMIRQTGMKIKDADRLSGYIPFSAVMFIEGDGINEKLRMMENPEHTEWQPERSPNPYEAKELIRTINIFMKDCIEKCISEGNDSSIDVAGAGTYLPDIQEDEGEKNKEEAITDKTLGKIEKRKVSKKSITSDTIGSGLKTDDRVDGMVQQGVTLVDWPHTNSKKDYPPSPKPPASIDVGSNHKAKMETIIEVTPAKFRPICTNAKKGNYSLIFVPSLKGDNGVIELYLSGENGLYDAPLLKVETMDGQNVQFEKNKILGLVFEKDVPIKLKIELNYSDYCSMEVKAYANKT